MPAKGEVSLIALLSYRTAIPETCVAYSSARSTMLEHIMACELFSALGDGYTRILDFWVRMLEVGNSEEKMWEM